jgi:NAD(P)-dependent dehydrogenase (short-subunit alcohol dehydrogenase family)
MKLKDRVAVVTGSARGIGRAIAEALVAEGATVVITDRDASAAEATALAIGGAAIAVPCDVALPEQIDALFAGRRGGDAVRRRHARRIRAHPAD